MKVLGVSDVRTHPPVRSLSGSKPTSYLAMIRTVPVLLAALAGPTDASPMPHPENIPLTPSDLPRIPDPRRPQPQAMSRRLTHRLDNGSVCSLDIDTQTGSANLVYQEQSGTTHLAVLRDLPTLGTGRFIGLVCTDDSTIVIAEQSIVATLGLRALRTGITRLNPPYDGVDSFDRPFSSYMRGTRVNSFVVSTDVHDGRTHVDVFILTQNQRLIYTDMLRYDSSGTPAFVNMLPLTSGFFTFPIDAGSHRTFMYRGSNGLLYILQQGSTQILELNPHPDSTATVRIASFYSPTPCTSNPTFSETPGFIEFNFDGTVVRRPNMQP